MHLIQSWHDCRGPQTGWPADFHQESTPSERRQLQFGTRLVVAEDTFVGRPLKIKTDHWWGRKERGGVGKSGGICKFAQFCPPALSDVRYIFRSSLNIFWRFWRCTIFAFKDRDFARYFWGDLITIVIFRSFWSRMRHHFAPHFPVQHCIGNVNPSPSIWVILQETFRSKDMSCLEWDFLKSFVWRGSTVILIILLLYHYIPLEWCRWLQDFCLTMCMSDCQSLSVSRTRV